MNLCSHYFATSGKKVLDKNGPYINTSQTKMRNVCLSVILSVVVCVLAPTYTSLLTGQNYLQKVMYISLVYILTWPNFWFSRLLVWADRKYCHMSENNIKNEQHLCLETHNFTKLSQNVILHSLCIDVSVLTVSYGTPLDFIAFFGYFYT